MILADAELDSDVWLKFSALLRTYLQITTTYLSRVNPVEQRNRDVNALVRAFLFEQYNTIATFVRDVQHTERVQDGRKSYYMSK